MWRWGVAASFAAARQCLHFLAFCFSPYFLVLVHDYILVVTTGSTLGSDLYLTIHQAIS